MIQKINTLNLRTPYQFLMIPDTFPFRISTFLLLLLASHFSFGQLITETQWYFGSSASNLQFDKNGIMVYEEDQMTAPFGSGGSTVISHTLTGNLALYSDGQRVYDASGQIMRGAVTLNGNPDINQSAVSSPLAGSINSYILFTNSGNSGVNEIQYSIVNMDFAGNGNAIEPLGEMRSANNSTGLTSPSEGMTIIKSSNKPNLYWLVSQNSTTFDFYVSRISSNGIDTTILYPLDNTNNPGFEAAQFAWNDQENVIAVAPKTSNRNVWILNFNDTTGWLSLNMQIKNTGFNDDAGESVYDVEWSNDGSKLYISRFGASDTISGNIYQYTYTDSIPTVIELLNGGVNRSYGLKRAIDGRIYHLYQDVQDGPYLIGRLSNIDSAYNWIVYEPQYFDTDYNGTQFPAFSPSNFIGFNTIDFTYIDDCQNNATKFFPIVDPIPTNYFWDLSETASIGTAPIHTFSTPATYNVTLFVELNGVIQSVSKPVTIKPNDVESSLEPEIVICLSDTILDAGVDDAESYTWNTGETTQTIKIDTAGSYWVAITSINGCTVLAETNVTQLNDKGLPIARQIRNQWYFGNKAGIDFNNPAGASPITDDNLINSPEAAATISDEDGNLLFYTDGITIWTKNHRPMSVFDPLVDPNIGGDNTASQGVTIVPFMDDVTMFYVFTANEVYGDGTYNMRYAIVDMKKDSALGMIMKSNLPLFDRSIEKVTQTGFATSSWLVSHEFGNNSYRSNLIIDQGISPTVYTPVGEVIVGQEPKQANGYMKFAPGNNNFANIIPGPNYLEIFDFDNGTGRFSNARLIETQENNNIYGLEYSPGGSKLYITTNSKLIQYDMDSLNTDDEEQDIQDSKYDDYATSSNYGALQRGPDGLIYMAKDSATTLGRIDNPESNDGNAGFTNNAFDLAGRKSKKGLPNFSQNLGTSAQQLSYQIINACFGDSTQFLASGVSIIDEFFWDFAEEDTSAFPPTGNGQLVTTYYQATGAYIIELNIQNRCGLDTLISDTVSVFGIPEQPLIPEETSLCNGEIELIAWDEDRPDLSYYWSNGDTTRVITLDQPNPSLLVAIINSDGCSSDTLEVFIGDGLPYLDLGPPQLHCQFEAIQQLDAQNTGVTYQWFIDGVNADTTRFLAVNSSTTGTFSYALNIFEPITKCAISDTVEINIQEAPDATPSFIPPSNCGESDAIINLEINSFGSYSFGFAGGGLITSGSLDGPAIANPIGGLRAGTYNYSITNIVTGCNLDFPILVDDDVPFDLIASNLPDCEVDANLRITVSGLALPDMVNLYVSNMQGDTILTQNDLRVPISIAPPLDSGIYYATIEDVLTGCFQSDSVLIAPYLPNETDCLPEIHAPNAFSPNGNNQNEEFFIYPNPFVNKFEIFIYSRWGQLVYYSRDKNFRWDGIFEDRYIGPGTLSYIIKYTSLEEPQAGVKTQYGAITVIR